jgi:PAS domain S-box-containing protein
VVDLEGNYLFVNQAFTDKFPFLAPHFLGQPYQASIHPDDLAKCDQAVAQCLAEPGKPVAVELRKPSAQQGDYYWTRWEFTFLQDNGQPVGILCLGHDITDVQRAHTELQEAVQQVDRIIDNITDGFYVVASDWRLLKANQAAEQMFGVPMRQYLGQSIWTFFADSDQYHYPAAFRQAMREQQTVQFEDYSPKLDRWYEATVYPSAETLTIFCRDTTERRRTRRQLEESENKLWAIMNGTNDSTVLVGLDLNILSFNQVAADTTEHYWQQTLLEGVQVETYIPPELHGRFRESFGHALAGEIITAERQLPLANGQLEWFQVKYYPVHAKDGTPMGVAINSTNIEWRKKAEEQLRLANRKLDAAYNSGLEAKALVGSDGKLLYFNEVSARLVELFFGHRPALGDNFFDYIMQDRQDSAQYFFAKALAGEAHTTESEIRLSTGKARWYRSGYSPVYDDGLVIGVSYTVNDITGEKRKEQKILAQNKALRAIAWQQSHEVRGPLASIMGLAKLMERDAHADQATRRDYLAHLRKATTALDLVIKQIVERANQIV